MFQFVFETALFRFKAKGPTWRPLLQLPPTIASTEGPEPTQAPALSPYIKFLTAHLLAGEDPRTPCGYAAGCSQERAAPMYQLVYETALARAKAKGPTRRPAAQPPPTKA